MFRKDKDLVERSQTLLKNKEIKQLKTDLSKQFSYFERNQEDLNTLLPNKCNLTCTKLVNRTLLYSLDGSILFFDIEGRNNLFPTIHTLSLYPGLLPTVITWGPVSRFVLRGADFMGPGIASLEGLEGLVEKGKCALRIVGNSVPFAVGVSLKSFTQLSNAVTRKGKAMLVHHSYGDLISPKTPPNAGFTSVHEITPIEQVSDGPKDMENYDEDEEDSGNEKEGGVDGIEGKEESSGKLDSANGDDQEEGSTNELNEEVNRERDENEQEEEEDGDEEGEEEGYSIHENDEYLMQTLLITIKYLIKDKQLPLLVSTFWSQLQKSIPDITRPINIKRTSYKKVFSFLVFYCQNELQLLTITEDDNGIAKLTKITREHSLIKQFKYEKIDELKAMILQRESSTSSDPSNNNMKTIGGKKDGSSNQIQVSELYKVPKKLREVFHDLLPAIMASSKYGEYLQLSEVRDLLLQYIKKHDLEIPDKRSHLLITSEDPISEFCDVNDKKSKEAAPPSRTAVLPPPPPPPTGYDGMPLMEDSNKAMKAGLEDESYVHPLPQISSLSIYDQWNLSGGNEIKLKIHKDGLKNVNDLSDFPALSTSTADSVSSVRSGVSSSGISTSKIAGGSKIGGWGRDPSKPFKPIHLPSPQPAAVKAKASPSSAPASSQLNQKKDKVGKESGSNVKMIDADEEEVKVHQLSKEEFFKTLVSKLTLYHVIAPPQSDSAEIKSGSIPKIKILTEHRAGNKVAYPFDSE